MSVVGVEKEITESVYNNLHLVDGTCIEFINSQKLKRNNTSGACGIYKLKNNKYRASIGFKGKRFDLGTYSNFESALETRREAEELVYQTFIIAYEQWNLKAADLVWFQKNPFIFEDAVKLMRCYFISDLRILKKEVYEMLYIVDFKQYDIPNLQQFFAYVFDREISSYEDIEEFLWNESTL